MAAKKTKPLVSAPLEDGPEGPQPADDPMTVEQAEAELAAHRQWVDAVKEQLPQRQARIVFLTGYTAGRTAAGSAPQPNGLAAAPPPNRAQRRATKKPAKRR